MTSWTDYQDDISDAISESMDVDWSANDGSRAVVHWLNENKPLAAAPAAPQAAGVGEREIALALREARNRLLHSGKVVLGDIDAIMDAVIFLEDQAALRAQPQAREDAQPVAWRVGDDGAVYTTLKAAKAHVDGWRRQGMTCCDPQPLYAHPAPDALRAAVDVAVQNAVARSMAEDPQWSEMSAPARAVLMLHICRRVTDALQDEQKGGAA